MLFVHEVHFRFLLKEILLQKALINFHFGFMATHFPKSSKACARNIIQYLSGVNMNKGTEVIFYTNRCPFLKITF